MVKSKTNRVAGSSLKLLTVSDLMLSSAPRKRAYLFIKGHNEPLAKKGSEYDSFISSVNEGSAISFYKREKISDESNSQQRVAISRFGKLFEKFCKPCEEESPMYFKASQVAS